MLHEKLLKVLRLLNSRDRILNYLHIFKMFSQKLDNYLLKDFIEELQ